MAIAFKDSASSASATVTLPSHATDDLIIGWAVRSGNATPPDLPSGWQNIDSGATVDAFSYRLCYLVATGSSETNPTFTNAEACSVALFTGCDTTTPIGSTIPTAEGGGGLTATYPGGTLDDTSGSSWLIRASGSNWGAGTFGTPGDSTTVDENIAGNGVNILIAHKAGTTTWISTTGSTPGDDDWVGHACELLEAAAGAAGPNLLTLLGVG